MGETKKKFSFYLYSKPTLVIIDWYNIWNKNREIDPQLLFDYLKNYPEIYKIKFYNGLIEGKSWSQKILDDAKSIGYDVMSKKSKLQPIDIRDADHFQSILKSLDTMFDDIKSTNSSISNDLYSIKDSIDSSKFDVFSTIDTRLNSVEENINSFKEESKKPILKTKCDFDAEIARDMILEMDNYQNLVLFSGDGDFASTVNFLIQNKNKRVFVVYPSGSFGELDYIDNELILINDDKNKTYKKGFNPIPVYRILENIIKKAPADFSAGPDEETIANSIAEVNA